MTSPLGRPRGSVTSSDLPLRPPRGRLPLRAVPCSSSRSAPSVASWAVSEDSLTGPRARSFSARHPFPEMDRISLISPYIRIHTKGGKEYCAQLYSQESFPFLSFVAISYQAVRGKLVATLLASSSHVLRVKRLGRVHLVPATKVIAELDAIGILVVVLEVLIVSALGAELTMMGSTPMKPRRT